MYLCQCSCGNEKVVYSGNLRSGNTKNCGCANIKHNYSGTKHNERHPLYTVLHHIKDRCYNQKNLSYKNYGSRGIKVCDEWVNDYKLFIEWSLSNGWESGLSIDRINNDGNYEPDNCRFITIAENNRNQRLIRRNNTSGYRGINKNGNKWIAQITVNSKTKYLGTFNSPKTAALRFDAEAFMLNDGRPMNFIEKVNNLPPPSTLPPAGL